MLPYPDDDIDILTLTLDEFNHHCKALVGKDDTAFVRAALAGRVMENNAERRVYIDVPNSMEQDGEVQPSATCFAGYVEGITTNFPFTKNVELMVVPRNINVLTPDIGERFTVELDVSATSISSVQLRAV